MGEQSVRNTRLMTKASMKIEVVRRHWRMTVNSHLAGSQVQGVRTRDPNVPTQSQVNAAMQRFTSEGVLSALRQRWMGETRLRWNPLQPPGRNEAHQPPPRTASAPRASFFGRDEYWSACSQPLGCVQSPRTPRLHLEQRDQSKCLTTWSRIWLDCVRTRDASQVVRHARMAQ